MFTDGSAINSIQTVTIASIIEDTLVEGPETFTVNLEPSNPGAGDTNNFILGTIRTSTIIIDDNDCE